MSARKQKAADLATIAIHGGSEARDVDSAVVNPLVQSVNFIQEIGTADGLRYPRYGNAPNAEIGLHRYWRAAFTDSIPDELIGQLVEAAAKFSSSLSAFLFFYMHGAGTRVPVADTAFSARRPQWDFDAIGQWRTTYSSGKTVDPTGVLPQVGGRPGVAGHDLTFTDHV